MSGWPPDLADAAALVAWAPLMVPSVPLLIACLLAVAGLRARAVMAARWAAAPALLTALTAPDTHLALPVVLLGSSLELDALGRPFLLAVAVLWLVAGGLGREDQKEAGHALLLLLAMSGTFAMALAADLSLFLLASTVSGYSLYGLLSGRARTQSGTRSGIQSGAQTGSQTGTQMLVLLLVLSDLILFECLLLLVHAGEGLELASLPQSLADAPDNGLLLGLLLLGFGAKAGLLGVHYWLAPTICTARAELRPAVIAFLLTAGLLPWTRLLAPGAVYWPEAGLALQWLALATAGFALGAGLLQRHRSALASYTVMALTGLWLALFGTAMTEGAVAKASVATLASVIAQSGLALSALLLIGPPAAADRWRWLRAATVTATALLLADAVLTALALLAADSHAGTVAAPPLAVVCAAAGLLVGRTLHLTLLPPLAAREPDALPAAMLLTVGAALMAAGHAGGLDAPLLDSTAFLLGSVAGLLFEPLGRRLPSMPPGDLGQPIATLLHATARRAKGILAKGLGHWRDQVQARLARASPSTAWRQGLAAGESALRTWRTAILLVLTAAAIAAGLVMTG